VGFPVQWRGDDVWANAGEGGMQKASHTPKPGGVSGDAMGGITRWERKPAETLKNGWQPARPGKRRGTREASGGDTGTGAGAKEADTHRIRL